MTTLTSHKPKKNSQKPTLPPVYKNFKLITLYTKVKEDKNAIMRFGTMNDRCFISVYTNIDEDKENKNGTIFCSMTAITFMCFLSNFEKIINSQKTDIKEKIDFYSFPRDANGEINGDKRNYMSLFYGKDAEGYGWISVIVHEANGEPKRPKLKFKFESEPNIVMCDHRGEVVPPVEVGRQKALNVIHYLKEALNSHSDNLSINQPYAGETTTSSLPLSAERVYDPDDDIVF